MRFARQSGWRSAALERLPGLVLLGRRNLDRVDLRTEALACLAEMDVRLQSKLAPDFGSWQPRAVVCASALTGLHSAARKFLAIHATYTRAPASARKERPPAGS
jgi:hypothetical protein